MILNSSSGGTFQECREKVWNWRELRLESKREAEPLTIGAAFHAGLAAVYKKAPLEDSLSLIRDVYLAEMGTQMILPEERPLIEQNIAFAQNSLREYQKYWKDEPIQVLMPEVKFRVALPDTMHHCYFVHRLLHPDDPNTKLYAPSEWEVNSKQPHLCEDKRCWHPHYYTGITDAVITWQNQIWLGEHKTSGIFSELYLDRFRMDKQPRGYLYGIEKSIGVRPKGFILNVIKKPRKDAKDPTRPTGFVREPFLVSDRELEEFEKWAIQVSQDYEEAFRTGNIYQNNHSCVSYNRRCPYFNSCLRGEHDLEEFSQRPNDYVDEQYLELVKEVA